jgi:hypothetical protein
MTPLTAEERARYRQRLTRILVASGNAQHDVESLRLLDAYEALEKALADVVRHARPAFPRTEFRRALDNARSLTREDDPA